MLPSMMVTKPLVAVHVFSRRTPSRLSFLANVYCMSEMQVIPKDFDAGNARDDFQYSKREAEITRFRESGAEATAPNAEGGPCSF